MLHNFVEFGDVYINIDLFSFATVTEDNCIIMTNANPFSVRGCMHKDKPALQNYKTTFTSQPYDTKAEMDEWIKKYLWNYLDIGNNKYVNPAKIETISILTGNEKFNAMR